MNSEEIKQTADEITLKNACLEIVLSSYGAAVKKILYKNKNSSFKNIAFTLLPEHTHEPDPLYAGATLAPAAGRIKNGVLSLKGKTYQLTKNEQGIHHIHGGKECLSFCRWEISSQTDTSVIFSAFLKDGVDGYPGNRKFIVRYTLKDHCLEIQLYVESDAETYCNLSNHTYFNLNAFSSSGLDQYLRVSAGQAFLNDTEHIPQYPVDTADTEFDFLSPTYIGERISSFPGSTQFQAARGVNHYFLLSEKGASSPACSLISADGETSLLLYTDAPALVIYSGGFIDRSLSYLGDDGKAHSAYSGCAVAIEPSFAPFTGDCPYGSNKFERFIRWEFRG